MRPISAMAAALVSAPAGVSKTFVDRSPDEDEPALDYAVCRTTL